MLTELHLFAGVGGGILGGILLGHVPVCAVEIDPYCRKVLEARQADGCLPVFPILDDVRKFDGTAWRGKVDVVCGGFPCQPWSTAGKRLGTADPRHLWPEMARIISEVRPAYVFAENVSLAAFAEPWRDLRGMGYRVPPALCLGASHVGAPHRRLRWWMLAADADRGGAEQVADASCIGPEGGSYRYGQHQAETRERDGEPMRGGSGVGAVPNPNSARLAQRQGESRDHGAQRQTSLGNHWWATEPRVGRVANRVASRVDRLRAIGNAQVPQVAAAAFRELMGRLA